MRESTFLYFQLHVCTLKLQLKTSPILLYPIYRVANMLSRILKMQLCCTFDTFVTTKHANEKDIHPIAYPKCFDVFVHRQCTTALFRMDKYPYRYERAH